MCTDSRLLDCSTDTAVVVVTWLAKKHRVFDKVKVDIARWIILADVPEIVLGNCCVFRRRESDLVGSVQKVRHHCCWRVCCVFVCAADICSWDTLAYVSLVTSQLLPQMAYALLALNFSIFYLKKIEETIITRGIS